tara:strand:+ start:32 stop:163 length:132 start_codon:yes stop_codon:yes gene_type:complete
MMTKVQQNRVYVEKQVTENRAISVVNFLNLSSVTEQKVEGLTQ